MMMATTGVGVRPKGFTPATSVRNARFVDTPQFAQTYGGQTGSKKKGLVYEQKVRDHLDGILPDSWEAVPGPWFHFSDGRNERYAQADWLAFDFKSRVICIGEIKFTRVANAWWQLNRLYGPIVRSIFPTWQIAYLEIAKNVRNVATPTPVRVVWKLEDVKPEQTSFMQVVV